MQRIVVAVDGSELSRHAYEWALRQAHAGDASLSVVTAAPKGYLVEPTATLYWIPDDDVEDEAKRLQHSILEAVENPGVKVDQSVVVGHPTAVLCEHAADADFLVMGARGLGIIAGAFLGSIAHQVVSHTTRPVVVVGGDSHLPRKILVAVDGSEHADRAAVWAAELARVNDARIELVTVTQWSAIPMMGTPYLGVPAAAPDLAGIDAAAQRRLDRAQSHLGSLAESAERTTLEGPVAVRLHEHARATNADLIVVGSRGMGGFKGLLLGSVSHRVLQDAPCPVAVIP